MAIQVNDRVCRLLEMYWCFMIPADRKVAQRDVVDSISYMTWISFC